MTSIDLKVAHLGNAIDKNSSAMNVSLPITAF